MNLDPKIRETLKILNKLMAIEKKYKTPWVELVYAAEREGWLPRLNKRINGKFGSA